jgi:hypothetical protein
VDRKEFLKSACGLGACGCALGLSVRPEPLLGAQTQAPDQRLVFARYQLAKLVSFMKTDTPEDVSSAILEKTGRECCKLGQVPAKFKGDPEGYFAAIKQLWNTGSSWDKAKGIITVTVPDDGPCGCPLVDSRRTPAFWCNCSVGYQKEAFETVFGKPVQVSLQESKLRGGKQCVFAVKLA